MQAQPKMEDAMEYLEQVKQRYTDNPKAYTTFLEIMKDFKGDKMDTDGFIKAIKKLFEGQRDLIVGFNFFLPPEIKIPEEPEPEPPQYMEPKLPQHAKENSTNLELSQSQSQEPLLPLQKGSQALVQSIEPPVLEKCTTETDVSKTKKYINDVRIVLTNEQFTKFQKILGQASSKNHLDVLKRVRTLFQNRNDLIDRFNDHYPHLIVGFKYLFEPYSAISEPKAIISQVSSKQLSSKSIIGKPEPQEGQLCIVRLEGDGWPWCVAELREKKSNILPRTDRVWKVWWYGNEKGDLLLSHIPWWRSASKLIYGSKGTVKTKGLSPIEDDVEQGTFVWWGFKLTSGNRVPADILEIISKNPKVNWTQENAGKTRKATPEKSKNLIKKQKRSR